VCVCVEWLSFWVVGLYVRQLWFGLPRAISLGCYHERRLGFVCLRALDRYIEVLVVLVLGGQGGVGVGFGFSGRAVLMLFSYRGSTRALRSKCTPAVRVQQIRHQSFVFFLWCGVFRLLSWLSFSLPQRNFQRWYIMRCVNPGTQETVLRRHILVSSAFVVNQSLNCYPCARAYVPIEDMAGRAA